MVNKAKTTNWAPCGIFSHFRFDLNDTFFQMSFRCILMQISNPGEKYPVKCTRFEFKMRALPCRLLLELLTLLIMSSCSLSQDFQLSTEDVYVSQVGGKDTPSCGSQSNPCRTIAMGVWRARPDTRVYVDGTGSEVTPYTCKSSSLELPGIYSNKSLAIIGVRSLVHVKCQEGYGMEFSKSSLDEKAINAKITNIKMINSLLHGQDASFHIDRCIFADCAQAIHLVQSSRPVTISFTNSECVNTSTCIIMNITNSVQPTNKTTIRVTNSTVTSSWFNIPYYSASGIHVTSIGQLYNPGAITCGITLRNVTFRENNLGKYGLIYVKLKNTLTWIHMNGVQFLPSNINDDMTNLITVKDSYNHDMVINNTKFYQNYQGFCRALEIQAKTAISLYISKSKFEKFNIGHSFGVLNLVSDESCQVTVKDTTFWGNTAEGKEVGVGGCLALNSQTSEVNLQESHFILNQVGCAGILWLNVEDTITTTIQTCFFNSNTAFISGGIASIQGRRSITTIVNSFINGTFANGPGGLLDIGNTGCGVSKNMHNSTLIIRGLTVIRSGSNNAKGGVVAMNTQTGYIIIQDSKISNVSSLVEGGVICAVRNYLGKKPVNIMEGYVIRLINSTFHNIRNTGSTGVVLYSNGIRKLDIENVTIDTISSGGTGSTVFLDSSDDALININNTIIQRYYGYGSALVLFITANVTLTIENSVFRSNTAFDGPGGCMSLTIVNGTIFIRNVTFKECYCIRKHGGAARFAITRGTISIKSCRFINNSASGDSGGAAAFELLKDEITNPGCQSKRRIWKYQTLVTTKETFFVNNTALLGGALSLSKGHHTVRNCFFTDNFAQAQGGHIFMKSDSTSLQILDSKFLQKQSVFVVSYNNNPGRIMYGLSVGYFISSQSLGPLVILNSTLEESDIYHDGTSRTLILLSNENYINFGEDNQTVIKCHKGSDVNILKITSSIDAEYRSHQCNIAINILQWTCQPCHSGTYSLQQGHSLGMKRVSGFRCLPCPFGADCQNSISAKPNFWGFKVKENTEELNFTLCPLGYCGNLIGKNNFVSYNSCNANRTGPLCGRCKENFTETLMSPSCRHDDECNDNWLWGVATAMAMTMALYLIHKPGFSRFLKREILWFRSHSNKDNEELDNQPESKYQQSSGGYLKIVFYFYQVANLLLVDTISSGSIVNSYIIQPILGFFNFQFRYSSSGFICPFSGLTSVNKQLLLASQVLGVVFMIGVCYCCHRVLFKITRKPPPNLGCYLGAFLETLLLGYAVYATTSLKLLRCTSIGSESRLFIAGNVLCYQWWQYLMMVFFGIVILPFIMTLTLGSCLLHKESISVKEFFFGCVLPLPYLVYKVISVCRRPKESRIDPRRDAQLERFQEPPSWKASVTNVLYGPFRRPQDNKFGAVYWEGILISRRLILILIDVLVKDPLSKALLLVLTCIVILVHHNTVRPFHQSAANTIESVSLFTLIVIATINAFHSTFLSLGQVPLGPLQSIATVLDWVQATILIALPVLGVIVVLATILSQIIRLIIKVIVRVVYSWKARDCDETRPLLEPQ